MMDKRIKIFIDTVLPLLIELHKDGLSAGMISPEGLYYGCPHCDMMSGIYVSHDRDCLSDIASKTLESFLEAEKYSTYRYYNWGEKKGQPRPEQEVIEIIFDRKLEILLNYTYPSMSLRSLAPIDYGPNVICSCHGRKDKCIHNALSQALATFLTP